MSTYDFSAQLWLHSDMPGAWYFITLPLDASDEIRATRERRGFGSVRIRATIGATTWDTSIFPDTKTDSYLLPVKAAVRHQQAIDEGDLVAVTITTR